MTKAQANTGFTGRHMAITIVGFFLVVIVVNMVMARLATSTFGGVVVENSYVASQHYNRWLAEARAQDALGWDATASRLPDGRVTLALSGLPQGPVTATVIARHPLGRLPERRLVLTGPGDARLISAEALPAGRWRLRIELAAAGRDWRKEQDLP